MSTATTRRGGCARAVGRAGAVVVAAFLLVGCTAVPAETMTPSPAAPSTASVVPRPPDADFATIERDLKRALTDGDPGLEGVRSVLVSVAGTTVIEYYHQRRPTDHADVWSVTKSVTSILVGIAVDDGLLTVDQTLAELLPDHAA